MIVNSLTVHERQQLAEAIREYGLDVSPVMERESSGSFSSSGTSAAGSGGEGTGDAHVPGEEGLGEEEGGSSGD